MEEVRSVFFRRFADGSSVRMFSCGLRRGLHSFAASRLESWRCNIRRWLLPALTSSYLTSAGSAVKFLGLLFLVFCSLS